MMCVNRCSELLSVVQVVPLQNVKLKHGTRAKIFLGFFFDDDKQLITGDKCVRGGIEVYFTYNYRLCLNKCRNSASCQDKLVLYQTPELLTISSRY
jgi:hypothetical protein